MDPNRIPRFTPGRLSGGTNSTPRPPAPVNTIAPVVSGSVGVGNTLSSTTGTWTNSPTFVYQWFWADSVIPISGATSSTYLIDAGDQGHTLCCVVTGSNGGGSASASSNVTSAVPVLYPVNTVAPAVSGTTTVGSTLSTTNGTWTGSPSFTYQWYWADTSAPIGGATSATYDLVTGDIGHTIKCIVTGTNVYGVTPANSNTTATITSGGATNLDTALKRASMIQFNKPYRTNLPPPSGTIDKGAREMQCSAYAIP